MEYGTIYTLSILVESVYTNAIQLLKLNYKPSLIIITNNKQPTIQTFKIQIQIQSTITQKLNSFPINHTLKPINSHSHNHMYRPQSQASRRQKSNDIRDLRSKSKNITNKLNKQHIKRILENTPNYIDTDRRLIIQNHATKNQLKQRLQKKNSQDNRQMLRSGVIRFIKPYLSQLNFKRFKKLFDISQKVQKCKHQIMSINMSAMKYGKDAMSLQQNQRLKELRQLQLKLMNQQEKILLEIQNQGKENKLSHMFMNDKNSTAPKPSHLINTHSQHALSELKPTENTQNVFVQHVGSSTHKRKQSSLSKKSRQTPSSNTDRNPNYVFELFEYMWNLDQQVRQNYPDKTVGISNNEWMVKGIKDWIKKKYDIIEGMYVDMAKLCKIANIDCGSCNDAKGTNKRDNHAIQQSMKSPKSYQSYNQVFKSSTIKNIQKNFFHQTQKPTLNSLNRGDLPQDKANKEGMVVSFSKMWQQLQKQLKEINHLQNVNKRNDELVKQVLKISGELKHERQHNLGVEKEKIFMEKQLNDRKQQQEVSSMVKKDNQLLKKRNQKLDQDNTKLLNEIHKMKNQLSQLASLRDNLQEELQLLNKQLKESEKYYRQNLSRQKQVKILSQQNQRINNQLQQVKEQYDELIATMNKKQDQAPQSNNNNNSKLSYAYSTEQKKRQHSQIQASQQKSIKSSSVSLMQKQIQKNNKKLIEQNHKLQHKNKELLDKNKELQEINKEIQHRNNELQHRNKELLDTNKELQQQLNATNDQIIKLVDENNRLVQEINSLSEENHKISQFNHRLTQQNHKIIEDNKKLTLQKSEQMTFLEQQNTVLLEENKRITQENKRITQENKRITQENKRITQENKKIQEEFQYIVKEKLQLQSIVNKKNKQNTRLVNEKERIIINLKEKLVDLQQNTNELKQSRQLLMREIIITKQSVGEMFSCINEEITSAFGIFVNEFSQKIYLKQQQQQQQLNSINNNNSQDKSQQTQANYQVNAQQQPHQQLINQNLSTIPKQQYEQQQPLIPQEQYQRQCQQQYEEQMLTITQQYQALAQQLNHCVYELNTYKSMLNQVQIQKELQKKYLEEDITQLRAKLSLVEKQYALIKVSANKVSNLGQRQVIVDSSGQVADGFTQTEVVLQINTKNTIVSNVVSVQQQVSRHLNQQQVQQPIHLRIHSQLISSNYQPFYSLSSSTLQHNHKNNLKINCESFSINIPPKNHTQTQIIPYYQPQQQQQEKQQQLMTLSSWLQQIKLQSQTSTEIFKSFCSINLNSDQSSYNNFLCLNQQLTQLETQNNLLKLQIQKLNQDNTTIKSSMAQQKSMAQYRSPLKDILSPNEKTYSQFDNNNNNLQADENKPNIMGSLYNKFSFPKLPHHQNPKQTFSKVQSHNQKHEESYPPLQKLKHPKQSSLQQSNKQHTEIKTKKTTFNDKRLDQSQAKLPSNLQDEDQSFDLCII